MHAISTNNSNNHSRSHRGYNIMNSQASSGGGGSSSNNTCSSFHQDHHHPHANLPPASLLLTQQPPFSSNNIHTTSSTTRNTYSRQDSPLPSSSSFQPSTIPNQSHACFNSSSFPHASSSTHTCMDGPNNHHMYLHSHAVYNNTTTTMDHPLESSRSFHSSMFRPSTMLSNSALSSTCLTNRDSDDRTMNNNVIQQVHHRTTNNHHYDFVDHDSIFPDLSYKEKQKTPFKMSGLDSADHNAFIVASSNIHEGEVHETTRRRSVSHHSGGSGTAAAALSPPHHHSQQQTTPPPRLMTSSEAQQTQQGVKRPNGQQAHITMTTITFEELSTYFDWKLEHACEAIGISSTSMKKLCRHFNIPRWPYRKLRSLYIKKDKILENMKNTINSKKLEQQLAQVNAEIEKVKTPSQPSAAYQLNNSSNTSAGEESAEENSDPEVDTVLEPSKKKKTLTYNRSQTPSTPPLSSQSSNHPHTSRSESTREQRLNHSPTLRKSPPNPGESMKNVSFRHQSSTDATPSSTRLTNMTLLGDNTPNFPVYSNPPLYHAAYSTTPPLSHASQQDIKPSEISNPFSSSNSTKLPSIHDLLKDMNTKREY
ncbi:hypothetical protein C9374_007689 [Naegleria lovaniensis]|uniref:RWP-RK domain-containing protein n=1 Tax=Naegleria lovaniensis TaxID=51637 RepID=A0AA88GKZ0_NAELO|nr:uncharacterized protein C9374_007689 [Naegleria lovaniensis]KAG2379051.1 hypothetical protein C9374_007689 [Naegleria lovaniensis]